MVNSSSALGGAGLSLLEIIDTLGEGWEPIVALPEDGLLRKRLIEEGVEVVIPPFFLYPHALAWQRKLSIFSLFRELYLLSKSFVVFWRLVSEIKPSLVVINSSTVQVPALVARARGIPVIWHVREALAPGRFGIRRALLRKVINRCSSAVVCDSNFALADIASREAPNKFHIVPPTLGLPHKLSPVERRSVRKELNIDPSLPCFAYVGQIYPQKGLQILIAAAVSVIKEYPHTQFLIIGDESLGALREPQMYFAYLKEMTRVMGVTQNFHFLGRKEDLSRYWEAIDYLVFPSVIPESFGRVVAEAMAHAKPVIATNLGGQAELVQDGVTGVLVEPHSPKALSRAMVKMLADGPACESMGTAALKVSRERFDPRRWRASLASLYRNIANRGRNNGTRRKYPPLVD